MLGIQELSLDNDCKFSAPVTACSMDPQFRVGQNSAFCRPDEGRRDGVPCRRVIFPSLHVVNTKRGPELNLSHHPLSLDSTVKSEESSLRTAMLPALSPSEREVLLARLDAVLPLPTIRNDLLPSNRCTHYNRASAQVSQASCPPALQTSSLPQKEQTPISSFHLNVTCVEPLIRKSVHEESLFSLNRLILPSWELPLPNPWGLKPVIKIDDPAVKGPEESSTAKPIPEPLPSILRKPSSSSPLSPKSFKEVHRPRRLSSSTSEASDLPSLASSHSSDSMEEEDDSHSCRVSFSPRVLVRLFARSKRERDHIWYSAEDMEQFKLEALERIQEYYHTNNSSSGTRVLPTGTGRVVTLSAPPTRLLFTHQALRVEFESSGTATAVLPPPPLSLHPSMSSSVLTQVAKEEIRKILLVDPHEICLDLFAKAFQLLQPHAVIRTASSSVQALALLAQEHDFDIMLVEERLDRPGKKDILGSGSTLLAGIVEETRSSKKRAASAPLLIGVTSSLERDQERLEQHGADVVWPKPPPTVNRSLQRDLLRLLLSKRGKPQQAESLL